MNATPRIPLQPRDLLILLVLRDQPLHGYGIVKAVEERSQGTLLLDPANLYRTLRRMRRDEWIEEVAVPEPEDPRRRTFGLTEDGRSALAAEVARLEQVLAWARPARSGEA